MSIKPSLICDRCRDTETPAPKKLPKGWLHDPLNDTHTCPKCDKVLKQLNDFLEWLPGRLCRSVMGTCWGVEEAIAELVVGDLYEEFKHS